MNHHNNKSNNIRVTVVKDRVDRHKSRGVAFILFVRREDAIQACKARNGTPLNERTLKVKIASDNGRSREFIKKRVYTNKSTCFECGVCIDAILLFIIEITIF